MANWGVRLPSFGLSRTWLAAISACLILMLAADALAAKGARRTGRDLQVYFEQYRELREKFARDIEEIAKFCDDKGWPDEARQLRTLAVPLDTREVRLSPLPRDVQTPIPNDLPPDERYWQTQTRFTRQDYAKQLYLLSRRALNAGHVSLAYDLVRETARHDSDHAPARKVLGFVRSGTEWVSPFESGMLRARKVWHDTYGWIPRDHVARYEKGERLLSGRWVSAAKEAEVRRDFSKAWEIRTEHYRIRTNHSLERGVELAKKLEDFHRLLYQMLAGFFNTQDQLETLFEGGSRALAIPAPHDVYFYRDREEYIADLKKQTDQQVEITKGMYFPTTGIAYFFFEPDADDSTLYHEATHQLLSGARPQAGQVGMKANFWIIEGIACYMESFRHDGESFSVGDPQHPRIRAARFNLEQEKYFVPLSEFAAAGMFAFQSDRQIRKNYSQCAAFTHFFMHYNGGQYREALIEHLSQIYGGKRLAIDSLADLTGVDEGELDRQYQTYLLSLDTAEAASRPTQAPAVGSE